MDREQKKEKEVSVTVKYERDHTGHGMKRGEEKKYMDIKTAHQLVEDGLCTFVAGVPVPKREAKEAAVKKTSLNTGNVTTKQS